MSIAQVLFSGAGFRQALNELASITGVLSVVTSDALYPYASFGLCDHDVRSPILDGSNAEVLITECPGVRFSLTEISPGDLNARPQVLVSRGTSTGTLCGHEPICS